MPTLAEDSQDAEVELGIHILECNSARGASRCGPIRAELLQYGCCPGKKGRRGCSVSKEAGRRYCTRECN